MGISVDSKPQAWLMLSQVPGIGSRIFQCLLDRFGHPADVLSAPREQLLSVEGMSGKLADAVAGADRFFENTRKEIEWLVTQGCRIVTYTDTEYPPFLRQIHDPPPFLYAYGQKIFESPAIGIVGSRTPTRYGLSMARRLSHDLADIGFVIVSGMARGIDTAAHNGALSAGGRTIAVLGSGLSVIYPPENKRLFHEISRSGTVLSEQSVFEPPIGYNFPKRNRIISGITLGTVVVEAARKSGSLITARLAAEQGREVFAVPGNINSFKSTGAHNLLKQGAKLVESVDDILEELSHMIDPVTCVERHPSGVTDRKDPDDGLTPDESDVYYLLDSYPLHIDELTNRSNIDPAKLSAVLLKLELKGKVHQLPGKFFCTSGE